MDEVTSIIQDSVVPVARQQKGFKGMLLLTNADTNKGMTITLWETEADMMALEASGLYQEQVAKVVSYFAELPIRELYEVSVEA